MPSYVPSAALELAKRFVRNERLGDAQVWGRIRQAASDMIWAAAPWRWTIAALNAIPLQPGVSSYGVTFPADFDYIHEAYISDGKTWESLRPVPALIVPDFSGKPMRVAAVPAQGKIMVAPVPAVAGWTLFVYYKKVPPVVQGNVAGELQMPDCWAWVYETVVLYYAYLYADDVRAGGVQVQVTPNGLALQFSGQRAAVEAAIALMREREPMPLPVLRASPDLK